MIGSYLNDKILDVYFIEFTELILNFAEYSSVFLQNYLANSEHDKITTSNLFACYLFGFIKGFYFLIYLGI